MTTSVRERPASVEFPDLRAVVYPASLPPGAGEELETLYSSLFSTLDWFETHDDFAGGGAVVLDDPRHVLVFDVTGDTVRVLNKAFAIPPADARRACLALFRAFPRARRVHLEVMCDPAELGLPVRVLYSTDHMIVDLPETPEAYYQSLGRSMKRNLRNYENRVRRDLPGLTTESGPPGERSRELLETFLGWKRQRFSSHGRTTYWDDDPRLVDRFVALLGRRGEAHVSSLHGRLVAILFIFPVGAAVCAQESAFDPAYEHHRLGLVSQYWATQDVITRGYRSFNLLWGTSGYKEHFGAVAHRATALSVFRRPADRFRYAGEGLTVLRRRLGRTRAVYWKARRRAGALLRRRPPASASGRG